MWAVNSPRPHTQPRSDEKNNPIGELFDGIKKGGEAAKHGLEKVGSALTRRPLPGNSSLLSETRVMLLLGSNPTRERQLCETVQMLGGALASRADLATHCIVREGLQPADLAEYREQLEICHALNVTVVEPSWLEAAATAARTQHDANWNAVLVDPHVP